MHQEARSGDVWPLPATFIPHHVPPDVLSRRKEIPFTPDTMQQQIFAGERQGGCAVSTHKAASTTRLKPRVAPSTHLPQPADSMALYTDCVKPAMVCKRPCLSCDAACRCRVHAACS